MRRQTPQVAPGHQHPLCETPLAAAFSTTLGNYRSAHARSILGHLIAAKAAAGFSSQHLKQVDAWEDTFRLLESFIQGLMEQEPRSARWTLLLEYPIPRRSKYPNIILLAEDLIFVIELKVGATSFESAARWQVEDYALDLRDFHLESQGRTIIPILVATAAPRSDERREAPFRRGTSPCSVACLSPLELEDYVLSVFKAGHQPDMPAIDASRWDNSQYRPSLNIIEAANELFLGHTVREISHATADNLSATTDALIRAVTEAQKHGLRTICFVTGVPGAGKTLTGLNTVHNPVWHTHEKRPVVFLSGNGPLVKIVRESLVRNAAKVRGWSKKQATREVGTFVQNVHAFLEEYAVRKPGSVSHEKVVIFDEAQRAWDASQVKKKRGLHRSEARLMLEIMERHRDWCVVIALVGGGQEIHAGEAGLQEWGQALAQSRERWTVVASPQVLHGETSLAGHRLFSNKPPDNCVIHEVASLHLSVSTRSYRAQTLNQWVNAILQGDAVAARSQLGDAGEFPLVMTRDLEVARTWLRDRSRVERRCGLVASSGCVRHRACGLEVSSGFRKTFPFEEWFLADAGDVRSSYQLEVAATEFECQGLELDWVGLCWGDDLTWDPERTCWRFRQFRGKQWRILQQQVDRAYLLNKYRVLLTRAREGMVLWIPPGSLSDPTRNPAFLDATYQFLSDAGVPAL